MDFFKNLLPVTPFLSDEQIVLNVLFAFILGLVIASVYRLTSHHKAVNPTFMLTLIILAMVVALVMMVIGNSIARAFSLVGALSIIRFRTAVKDVRDIAYVFFALAAGMASGIGNYRIALFGVSLILLLLVLLDFVRFGSAPRGMYMLRFQIASANTAGAALCQQIFDRHLVLKRQLAVKTVQLGQYVEHTYLIRFRRGLNEQTLMQELSGVSGVEKVVLLAEEELEEP